MKRYKRVKILDSFKFYEDCPVDILKSAVYIDMLTNEAVFQVKFINVQDKKVKAVYIQVKGYDDFGTELENEEYSYLDLNISRGIEFGTSELKKLKNDTTRNLKIFINKIVFIDNSIWEKGNSKGYKRIHLEKMNMNIVHIAREKIKKCEPVSGDLFYPCKTENYWTCICGAYNKNSNKKCFKCKNEKNIVLNEFNKNKLIQDLDKFQEKQKLSEEINYKKTKKGFIAIVVFFTICLIAMFCIKLYINEQNAKLQAQIYDSDAIFQLFTKDDYYALINKYGYVIELCDNKQNNITEIYTSEKISLKEHDKLYGKYLEVFGNLYSILQYAESNEINNITSIKIVDISKSEYKYVLEIEKEHKEINLGTIENLDTKFKYIKAILKQEKEHKGYIDVSDLEDVYFRENSN